MVAFAAAPAAAQSVVSGAYYQIDGWDIVPLLDGDPADPLAQTVHSLMLFRADTPTAPSNITAVWARRTATGWEADAWAGETRADVTMWMVNHTALPVPFSTADDWPLDGLAAEYVVAEEAIDPKPLGSGLPLGHPLEPAVSGMSDPTPLLETLEAINEPASSSSVTTPGASGTGTSSGFSTSCPVSNGVYVDADGDAITTETIWDAVANSIEIGLLDITLIDIVYDDTMNLAIGCCDVTRRYTQGTVTAWTCTPWTLTESVEVGNCRATSFYRSNCTRTMSRTCIKRDGSCNVTATPQTRTETRPDCAATMCDKPGAACNDPALPNCVGAGGRWIAPAPVPAPPIGAQPNGCAEGSSLTDWTPGC
jgi:hypothetical protein